MLPEFLSSLLSIDAATADLLWTGGVCTLLLAAGGVTLALLPWSDRDIARVDDSFKALCTVGPTGAPVRRATR